MALALSANSKLHLNRIPPTTPRHNPFNPSLQFQLPIGCTASPKLSISNRRTRERRAAVEKSQESAESEAAKEVEPSAAPASEATESSEKLGAEIKKAMMERKEEEKKGGELWSGVAEEIGEIEWPVFGKVLGTTGVVIGVIAGSSVVLLTVNAVLAELSDRVFAGRGIQDFF